MKLKVLIFFLSVIVLTSLTFSQFGISLNLKSISLFQKSHLAHPDIVILAVDNKSLTKFGRWPWSRAIHAQVINKLKQFSPLAIGIDIIFSEPENSDIDLAKSLSNVSFPVVLTSQAIFFQNSKEPQKLLLPLEQFISSPKISVGHVNLSSSEDGLTRNFPKPLKVDQKTYQPFSIEVANKLNSKPSEGDFLVSFAGPAGSFQTYSLADLMDNKIPKEKLSDKIILIGATASDLHDTILTPIGFISGVEYNANVLDNLLLSRSIILLPKIYPFLIGLSIITFYLLLLNFFRPKEVSLILISTIIILPSLSWLFWQFGLALFYLSNIVFSFLLFTYHVIYNWYSSEAEKRKIRQTFQYYFSPAVMNEILQNPESLKLGGQRREVTILFSDIRNFTTITESLPPEKLTQILKEYFTEMSKEILKTDGVLDKFIGDAIMTFWGAPMEQPDHADRAVRTAIAMMTRLKVLRKKWLRQGLPEINAGIGINSGVAIVGNMGSNVRFDYTLIGDVVNAASRLESLNKEYKTSIIISEDTKNKLTKKVSIKPLGQVIVKGKTKSLKIFSITI